MTSEGHTRDLPSLSPAAGDCPRRSPALSGSPTAQVFKFWQREALEAFISRFRCPTSRRTCQSWLALRWSSFAPVRKIVLDLPATRNGSRHTASPSLVSMRRVPAFYSQKSGLSVDATVNSSKDVADLVKLSVHWLRERTPRCRACARRGRRCLRSCLNRVFDEALKESKRVE